MKKFLQIKIYPVNQQQAEVLIAELSDIGFYAFEEEISSLTAYIKEEDFRERSLKEIIPKNVFFERHVISDRNWNQEWEKHFEPVNWGHRQWMQWIMMNGV